jgi:hypothetical protein
MSKEENPNFQLESSGFLMFFLLFDNQSPDQFLIIKFNFYKIQT